MYILYLATKYIPFCTTCSTCKWKFSEWQSFRKHRLGGFHFGKNSMIFFQERPLINIKLTKNCPQKLSFILSCLPQYYRWQFLDWTTMASESELSTDYYCSIGAIRRLLCHRPLPPPSRYQTPRSQPPTLCDIVISGCSKYHADDCAKRLSFLKFD